MVDQVNTITEMQDFRARGMATEAVQAIRSHEALNNLQFLQMDQRQKDLKDSVDGIYGKIDGVCEEMRAGFKSYDNKFWSLSITIMLGLAGIICALVYKLLFPH